MKILFSNTNPLLMVNGLSQLLKFMSGAEKPTFVFATCKWCWFCPNTGYIIISVSRYGL